MTCRNLRTANGKLAYRESAFVYGFLSPSLRAFLPTSPARRQICAIGGSFGSDICTTFRSLMRYGFVIDQDRCIGCHACTVACKEEHQVPIGVFRTWVKYVETGQLPETRRHFGVMRCNHCDDAPCIEICPTRSLFRRSDGIVDFDNRRCIGCKSCMQACPYDALYIDPNNNTAAKCNFCAHRVEQNLEPACVIVCPTQAILAGDMDDSSSKTGAVIANRKTVVRKPEKGTIPKLHYVGIHEDLLQPTRLLKQNTLL